MRALAVTKTWKEAEIINLCFEEKIQNYRALYGNLAREQNQKFVDRNEKQEALRWVHVHKALRAHDVIQIISDPLTPETS